jgi:branched-chain amino acid aminotransferase
MILPGVTRDSVVSLARSHVAKNLHLKGIPDAFEINERPITMKEVIVASKNGTLVEMFGAGHMLRSPFAYALLISLLIGTAAIICPVNRIGYMDGDIDVPTGDDSAGLGPISRVMLAEITGRQLGTIPSDWNVVVSK